MPFSSIRRTVIGRCRTLPILVPAQAIAKQLSANSTTAAAASLVGAVQQDVAHSFVAGAAILGAAAGGKAAATAVAQAIVEAAQMNVEVRQVARDTLITVAVYGLQCVEARCPHASGW